jgi:hypothetical protein
LRTYSNNFHYPETDNSGETGVGDIINWNQVESVIERLPAAERWTHYYKGKQAYHQLDYILVSDVLRPRVRGVEIERAGLPLRAKRYEGRRFPGVGNPKPRITVRL